MGFRGILYKIIFINGYLFNENIPTYDENDCKIEVIMKYVIRMIMREQNQMKMKVMMKMKKIFYIHDIITWNRTVKFLKLLIIKKEITEACKDYGS